VRLSPILLIVVMVFGSRIITGPSSYLMGLLDRMIIAMV